MDTHKFNTRANMEFDKETFFKAVDYDNHFNDKTKEAYWKNFVEKCDGNIQILYNDGGALYPEKTGLHQYVRYSLDKFFDLEEKGEKPGVGKPTTSEESKISPIDSERKKEPSTTWGYNDDVKLK